MLSMEDRSPRKEKYLITTFDLQIQHGQGEIETVYIIILKSSIPCTPFT
jgi:hypothetical protein